MKKLLIIAVVTVFSFSNGHQTTEAYAGILTTLCSTLPVTIIFGHQGEILGGDKVKAEIQYKDCTGSTKTVLMNPDLKCHVAVLQDVGNTADITIFYSVDSPPLKITRARYQPNIPKEADDVTFSIEP